ncbi:Brp/Blh family beta-carotene 15,15'-dioxygenase [Candidatus Pelagibacter sp.]|nr:Brp/Blh family beta-carotene 15,15'-dioxygenase [Candidatus Pelagibacter sp.]
MTIQIKKINFKHSFIFFLFCNIVSLPFIKAYNLSISPLVCLLLILIIGVSHGSLDHIKGRKLLKIFQIKNIITFYTSYFLLAVTIIILWVLLPTVVLIAFLIVASFHFGKEDTQFLIDNNSYLNQFLFFFKGSLVILAPLYFNFNETVSIFKLLLIENESFYQSLNVIENNNFLIIGIVLSALSSIILFFKKFELRKFTIFFDYFSIIIINMHFSPLIAFTIYFCFLHSIRHSISLITELDQESLRNGLLVFIKKATPLTILTAIFCLIGLYFLNNNYNLDSAILKLIFIGLASLTFPHILLEYLIEKNEK